MNPPEDTWIPPRDAACLAGELLAQDPLEGSPQVAAYFGERFDAVQEFAHLLAVEGETRGLLGPREYDRLWERHILNSAAVVPHLAEGDLADVGSGAGLPGVVIAAMQPHRRVVLVEPMDRRATWLRDVTRALGLDNVEVARGRAEEVGVVVDVVTARAVAAIDKLVKWCAPLLSEGGSMALLKGRLAADEVQRAKYALRKARLEAEIIEATTLPGLTPTTVVRLARPAASRG